MKSLLILLVIFISTIEAGNDAKIQEICGQNHTTSDSDLDQLCKLLSRDVANDTVQPSKKPSSSHVWGYGILCVTVISFMSVIGVSFIPLMSKSFYDHLLTTFIGLAVGSLSGSALFHLIPSAFRLSDVTVNHSYLNVSLTIWGGVYLFFMIERFLKIFMECQNAQKSLPNHNHQASVFSPVTEDSGDEHEEPVSRNCTGVLPASGEVYENSMAAMRASFGHMERPDNSENRPTVDTIRELEKTSKGSKIATVAWMIIFGDGVHNFIDGLSIGAAFSESILTGISVSAAVLCEEFPHELGDFAVLLNAGMTMRQAMVYNFLSACTCYIGLILGILLGELHVGNEYIFAAAGGMFLYIALVDMVPELNAKLDQLSKQSVKLTLFEFLLQNIGILIGIFSLFVLAKNQDNIQINF